MEATLQNYLNNLCCSSAVNCEVSTLSSIVFTTYFTISGTIKTEVWMEYTLDEGITWNRLPNKYPIGTSIVTNELPVDVNLRVRLVAVCDETLASNSVEYTIKECWLYEVQMPVVENFTISYINCDGVSISNDYTGPDTQNVCAIVGTLLVTSSGSHTISVLSLCG